MIIIDIEVYKDYFLFAALNTVTGNTRLVDAFPGKPLDAITIQKMMQKNTTVSFNGLSYDLPLITCAVAGWDTQKIKDLSDEIIKSNLPAWKIVQDYKIAISKKWDHVDLIEVAPGSASLKIYGGRLNAPTMRDLPLHPNASIGPSDREAIRSYCENDLRLTQLLLTKLMPQLELRKSMSNQYGLDLRSKSDAQIAETIIKSELSELTGKTYRPFTPPEDYSFKYKNPGIIEFQSSVLKETFNKILASDFTLAANGAVKLPDWLSEHKPVLGTTIYQMGIGGLHSCEKAQYVTSDEQHCLIDLDVASYYPNIILQQRLAPESLGAPFLKIYQSIVERRIAAKRNGDTTTADTLKICVNGSFGKLGSKYSALYAPELLLQTTLTGQLALLMLIDNLESEGIHVISANTDGIVIHCRKTDEALLNQIAWDWMLQTSYALERSDYRAIASRDVNNYVAVRVDGKTKGKGCFAEAGLQKNPDRQIVYDAVAKHIATGVSLRDTIESCRDLSKFCTVRRVDGGAMWRDEYLGKAVRFYHAKGIPDSLVYARNQNRVPTSEGCRPAMTLPQTFPNDVDFAYYICEAEKLLKDVGYA